MLFHIIQLCADDVQIQVIEEVNRVGSPTNTAAGQKASTAASSETLASSFTANLLPSAGFAAPGVDSFGTATTANAFGGSTTNAFPGPANFFSAPPSTSAVQQGSTFTGFAGMASSQPQTAFGWAPPASTDSHQNQTADTAHSGRSLVYTPLDQLSAEDRVQYEAAKFTLGHVPVRPPPKELI